MEPGSGCGESFLQNGYLCVPLAVGQLQGHAGRHGPCSVELLEVGRTLKADRWQRFRYITLPVISPSLGAASLIVFAYTFGSFEVPFLLGQTYPMMLPVWAYKNYSDVDLLARPEGIATGIIIAGVIIVAIVLAQTLIQAARRRGVVL